MDGTQVTVEAELSQRLSRLLIFVKWLLLLPHYVALYVLGLVFWLVSFLNWFAVLFTGGTPPALFDFNLMTLRYTARTTLYGNLVSTQFPALGAHSTSSL